MAFSVKAWLDRFGSGGDYDQPTDTGDTPDTPVDAAGLRDMEDRLSDYTDAREAAEVTARNTAIGSHASTETTARNAAIAAAITAQGDLATQTELDAHTADTSAAHNASAIAVSPAVGGDSDVQAVLATHETRLDAAQSGHVIEDEGTPVTARTNLNFTGGGVNVTDSGGKTVVTIAGGGVGSGTDVSVDGVHQDAVDLQTDAATIRTAIGVDTPSDTRTPTDGSVTAAKVNAALKPSGSAAAGTEALRALGSSASTAAAGNDSRFPAGADIVAGDIAAALKPSGTAAAGTEALRALGTSSSTAAAGDDSRFPTSGQKAALAGTDGTPGSGNKFVTDTDPRLGGGGGSSFNQFHPKFDGYLAQSFPRVMLAAMLSIAENYRATDGRLDSVWVPVPGSISVTSICIAQNQAGSSLDVGQNFAFITDANDGSIIGATADMAATWQGGTDEDLEMAIAGGPVTVDGGAVEGCYVTILSNTGGGNTVGLRGGVTNQRYNDALPPQRYRATVLGGLTGQTAVPAGPITLASNGNGNIFFWVGFK